jgi:hypothetical protein
MSRLIPQDQPAPAAVLQVGEINRGGIAALSDGTFWRIVPNDIPLARSWALGTGVSLTPSDPGRLWPFNLINLATGESVAVVKPTKFPND